MCVPVCAIWLKARVVKRFWCRSQFDIVKLDLGASVEHSVICLILFCLPLVKATAADMSICLEHARKKTPLLLVCTLLPHIIMQPCSDFSDSELPQGAALRCAAD